MSACAFAVSLPALPSRPSARALVLAPRRAAISAPPRRRRACVVAVAGPDVATAAGDVAATAADTVVAAAGDAAAAAAAAADAGGDAAAGGPLLTGLAIYVFVCLVITTVCAVGVTYQNWVLRRNDEEGRAAILARLAQFGGEDAVEPADLIFSDLKARKAGRPFPSEADVAMVKKKVKKGGGSGGGGAVAGGRRIGEDGNRAMRRRTKLEKKTEKRRAKRAEIRAARKTPADGMDAEGK